MAAHDDDIVVVYTRFITRGGKRIYHPNGGVYRLEIPRHKYRG